MAMCLTKKLERRIERYKVTRASLQTECPHIHAEILGHQIARLTVGFDIGTEYTKHCRDCDKIWKSDR